MAACLFLKGSLGCSEAVRHPAFTPKYGKSASLSSMQKSPLLVTTVCEALHSSRGLGGTPSSVSSTHAESIAVTEECEDSAPSTSSSVPTLSPPSNGQSGAHSRRAGGERWHKKADLYIVRTDGMSCSRETVKASGCLSFAHPSTQQQLLVWKTPPKCVLVLKKLDNEVTADFLRILRFLGLEEGMRVLVEPHEHVKLAAAPDYAFADTFSAPEAVRLHALVDFVVCLGGDGTILHASSLFQGAIPPVISFSLGSLGFLTNHSVAAAEADLRAVIYGSEDLDQCAMEDPEMRGVHITLRMRLFCQIVRAGSVVVRAEESFEVLNEVVVDRGANPYLAKIECWERDRLITKVQADGVMLATPTGSTAYSVAAGGSMVHPNVPAILFTPICPHSLSFRPVILPDYADLELRIPGEARCPAWVCFDGKQRQELQRGDAVRVRMSTNPVPTISRTDQTADWFGSLERCFGWNDRIEQKPWEACSSSS